MSNISSVLDFTESSLLAEIATQTINGIIVTDIDGLVRWVNPAFERTMGYTLDDMIGMKPGSMLQGPNTNQETSRRFRKAIEERASLHCQILNYHKDGHPVWLDVKCNPLRDQDGTCIGFVATETDITQQKLEALAAVRQEKLLSAMGEQARIGWWELDLESQELSWSPVTREIHGVAADFQPEVGSAINFYKAGEYRDRIQKAMEEAIASGGSWNEEMVIVTASGQERWVCCRGEVQIDNGRVTKLFGSFQDIDEQKRAADLLKRAKEEAEQATRVKSEFLATMSHEVRTPMNGVLGMLELLSRTSLTDKQTRYLTLCRSSAEAQLYVINDILDFSKLNSGKLLIENISFDLHELVTDLVEEFSLQTEGKNFELKLDAAGLDDKSLVSGDPQRIRQVLSNLLSNAIKFTEKGSVQIKVNLQSKEQGKAEFRCSVIDSGIGIPPAAANELFEAFTQVDASTSRHYGGTGLGLRIAKDLCQMMGGDLWLENSTPDVGSEFAFTCALQSPPEQSLHAPQAHDSERPPAGLALSAATRVLVVEDNAINQFLMEELLSDLDIQCELSENGEEALNRLQDDEATWDLILMDCQMPKLDGYETTRRIRAGSAGRIHQDVPILALTANAMEGERERCLSAGMNDYLTKPLDPERFALKVGQWLN